MTDLELHDEVAKSYPAEYVEAVVEDAMKILPSFADREEMLIVVNQRRLAIVLDKKSPRKAAIPVALVEEELEGVSREKLQAWIANPTTLYYVAHISGFWFPAE